MREGLNILGVLCVCISVCGFGGAAAEPEGKEKDATAPKWRRPAASKPGRMTITRDGSTKVTCFRSIQKAVEALQPGDILTIGSGEYFGSVTVSGLGDPSKETIIRAEIPGTVVLRGDVPVPPFRPVAGSRFVYVADFDHDEDVQAVNELDTLTIYSRSPNMMELDFTPGKFYHDKEGSKLFVSSSDLGSPDTKHYTATLAPGSGLELIKPQRTRIEGLVATGFNSWGIVLKEPNKCIIADCLAYLNCGGAGPGGGIATKGIDDWGGERVGKTGDNVIERCAAWANKWGIMIEFPQRDVIRDSTAFLNNIGFRIYNGIKSLQERNLGWGNMEDYLLKEGGGNHEGERSMAAGMWRYESHRSIMRRALAVRFKGPRNLVVDSVMPDGLKDVDMVAEFADPANHDYRLQATSRFRGAAKDGSDLGPFPYKANVFFVSPKGNDGADGLSAANAWLSLDKASRSLRPGDTLYLEPGRYGGDFRLAVGEETTESVSIRGRGEGMAELTGDVKLENCGHLSFARLRFKEPVSASGGSGLSFDQCAFDGDETGVAARNVQGLRMTNCEFRGNGEQQIDLVECGDVFLAGNLFDNAAGAAVAVDRSTSVLHADHNCYARPSEAWQLAGKVLAMDRLPEGWERYATEMNAEDKRPGIGFHGRLAGNYRMDPGERLRVLGPFVYSAGTTSANIEWFASNDVARAENCKIEIAWGETPECAESRTLDSRHFGSFSLTGLRPETRYYVQLRSVTPSVGKPRQPSSTLEWNAKPVAFKTARATPKPVTYYVSPLGDDANPGHEQRKALRTLARACELVRPGDTVRVAGGVYRERLRVRVSGEAGRPITFAAIPGEQVTLDGDTKALDSVIVAFNKSHVRFDGFFLRGMGYSDNGAIDLSGGEDIQITRCFYDGRHGFSPSFVYAIGVRDLLIRNCVSIYAFAFSPRIVGGGPGFRMENSVIIHNLIGGTLIDGDTEYKAVLQNNIITDCQANKIKVPICPIASSNAKTLRNNAYFLRPERQVQGTEDMVTGQISMSDFAGMVARDGGLIGDPRFAVLHQDGIGPGKEFPVDVLIQKGGPYDRPLTFSDLFATNPEFVKRGIGLNPEDFKDFYSEGK